VSEIQVSFSGDETEEAQKQLQKIVHHYLGAHAMTYGATAGGMLKAFTALTLVIAIPAILASPRRIFQQLGTRSRQMAFFEALQKLTREYNIEIFITIPDGRRIDLRTISVEDLIVLLTPSTK